MAKTQFIRRGKAVVKTEANLVPSAVYFDEFDDDLHIDTFLTTKNGERREYGNKTFVQNIVLQNTIRNEVPLGDIDGINCIFHTRFMPLPNTVEVFVNGVKQNIVQDYNITGDQIILHYSLTINESININYLKQ